MSVISEKGDYASFSFHKDLNRQQNPEIPRFFAIKKGG
jgi:hypothetical protein